MKCTTKLSGQNWLSNEIKYYLKYNQSWKNARRNFPLDYKNLFLAGVHYWGCHVVGSVTHVCSVTQLHDKPNEHCKTGGVGSYLLLQPQPRPQLHPPSLFQQPAAPRFFCEPLPLDAFGALLLPADESSPVVHAFLVLLSLSSPSLLARGVLVPSFGVFLREARTAKWTKGKASLTSLPCIARLLLLRHRAKRMKKKNKYCQLWKTQIHLEVGRQTLQQTEHQDGRRQSCLATNDRSIKKNPQVDKVRKILLWAPKGSWICYLPNRDPCYQI